MQITSFRIVSSQKSIQENTMFRAVFVAVVVGAALTMAYDAKFDQFDAEAVVSDLVMLEEIMECLTDTGACSDLAAAYKELMPEVVMTSCAKCTPRQKEIMRIVMGATKKNYPELYAKFKALYDPNNLKSADFDALTSL